MTAGSIAKIALSGFVTAFFSYFMLIPWLVVALGRFVPMTEPVLWVIFLTCIGISVYFTTRSERLRLRREQASREFANRAGNPTASDHADATNRLHRILTNIEHLAIKNLFVRQLPQAKMTVCEMRLLVDNSDGEVWERSTLLFECPNEVFPRFTLQEEKGTVADPARQKAMKEIDFSSHPHFSSHYHLHGQSTELVRQIFNSELLDYFESQRFWEIRAVGKHLLLMRDEVVDATHLPLLIDEAQKILSMFLSAVAPAAIRDAIARETLQRSQIQQATADQIHSTLSPQQIEKHLKQAANSPLVSLEEVNLYFQLPAPRDVNFRYTNELQLNNGCLVLGSSFAFLGIGLILALVGTINFFRTQQFDYTLLCIGIVGWVILITTGTLAYRESAKIMRLDHLLKNGTPVVGKIEEISPSGQPVDGAREFICKVRYDIRGDSHHAEAKLYGSQGELAYDTFEYKLPISILVAPKDPTKFLLALQMTSQNRGDR